MLKNPSFKNFLFFDKMPISNGQHTGALILPGLKLGDNGVVDSGTVVKKDNAEKQTILGVPAVVLWKI